MIPTDDTASGTVRQFGLRYRAHNGLPRPAVVLAPAQYGPENRPPPLPLVISPHRPRHPRDHERPVVARPAGARRLRRHLPRWHGRRLPLHSWGWRGQIADLARMPSILQATMPWLRVDGRRIYAVGGSMGGQETLLLVGQYPQLLARRGRLRFRHQLLHPLPRLRADSQWAPAAGARATRSRRHPERQDKGVRASQPDALGARGRRSRGAAAAVVERRRRDRRRPAAPVGTFL
jgi:dienelactone hydrolase